MSDGYKSKYAICLNALDEMQQSIAYAARKSVLWEAETIIVNLESENETLKASHPRWSRERPTQPGYYWWRRPNNPAALGRVFGPSPGLRFELFPDDEGDIAVSNTWEDTEWCGPLEVPG